MFHERKWLGFAAELNDLFPVHNCLLCVHVVSYLFLQCPDDLARQGSRGVDDFEDFSDGRQTDLTTKSGLVSLHGRVIKSTRNAKRTEV